MAKRASFALQFIAVLEIVIAVADLVIDDPKLRSGLGEKDRLEAYCLAPHPFTFARLRT